MSFNAPYVFAQNNVVVIKHKKGKYVRVKPGNLEQIDDDGGTGQFARWQVELDGQEGGLPVIKLKSTKSGKYMRIQGGNRLNAGGGGGKATRFKVHKTGQNSAKLESCKFAGKYPAVQKKGPAVGGGGKWTEWEYFRQGGGGGGGQQQQPQPQQVVYQQQQPQQPQVVYQQQPPQQQQQQYQQQPQQQQQYQQQPQQQQQYQQQPQQQQQYQQQPPQQQQYQQQPQQQQYQQQPPQQQGQQYQQQPQQQQQYQQQQYQQQQPQQQQEYKQQQTNNNNNNNNYQQQTFDPSQVHPQPFADAAPSIRANASNDWDTPAATLRSAMKGMGTNEKKLIAVTTDYSHAQRMLIRDRFDAKFGRSLMKDLASECGGKFEKVILALWYRPGELDSRLVYDAVDGMGFNTKLLNEVVCTRTNAQIAAMKGAWSKSPSMVERIKSETNKAFSNNTYQSFLLAILRGDRPANGPPNEQSARADAETLNRYLTTEKESAAKVKFVEIFTTRSWVQLRTISNVFQDVSRKYNLPAGIKKAFGDSSDTSKALCIVAEFVTQPYDYFAKELKSSMQGMGTNDEKLRRIITTRADVDLYNISKVFGQRYGDGKTLNNWIKNDTSGDYEKLLLHASGFK